MSSSSAPPPPVPHPSGGGGEEECSSTTSLLLCGTDAADALMTDAMKSCASGVPKLDLTRRGKDLLAKIKTTTPKLLGGGGGGGGGWTSRPSSLYDTYLCGAGGGGRECPGDDDAEAPGNDDGDQRPIPACRLDDPSRTICVVTTAALPWRTGTAVNPLLRALYLVRRRVEASSAVAAEGGGSRAVGTVALVVPWLESREERIKLYGEGNSFCPASSSDGDQPGDAATDDGDETNNHHNGVLVDDQAEGMAMQERWIRDYSSTSCGMPIESELLRIVFYPAFYLASFGSIFPKVDLCNYIPGDLVDIAVLEEPEHLNWFRMPYYVEGGGGGDGGHGEEGGGGEGMEVDGDGGTSSARGDGGGDDGNGGEDEEDRTGVDDEDDGEGVEVSGTAAIAPKGDAVVVVVAAAVPAGGGVVRKVPPLSSAVSSSNNNHGDGHKLGWTHRFRFVVGVVHTNYEEYARQYGIGASLIAAPAIGAISALTIRAHCHQVIKLSDTLPTFAPGKEITCNVHGVRAEFLEGVDMAILMTSSSSSTSGVVGGEENRPAEKKGDASPVYFIGKLVWAKGFDQMLDLQDVFRKRHGTYFPVDVYGGGPDEKAIARAFHGRHHSLPTKRPPDPTAKESSSSAAASPTSHPAPPPAADAKNMSAAAILANPQSIKEQLERLDRRRQSKQSSMASTTTTTTTTTEGCGDDVVMQYLSLGFEVSRINGSARYVREVRDNEDDPITANAANPLDILGDLSEKSFDTGIKTSLAVYNIADSSIKNILTMSFSQLKEKKRQMKAGMSKVKEKVKEKLSSTEGDGTTDEEKDDDGDGEDDAEGGLNKPKFVFDPPASRYEWRRRPIPAKFPGVVDHALLKNTPHKIFLNPSTSEVLCTTTAEALAMNKFVIIPRHPSNDFFLQFSNCLPYNTLEECADRMAWALDNSPNSLTDEERRKFTWEAATERLIESSIVTVVQARERAENGMDKTDARIAYWLSESGEKSNMIRNLFQKNNGGDHSPSNG